MRIRAAEERDLAGILAIENYEILNGVAHFGLRPLMLEETTEAFLSRGRHPWFVAADGDEVVGFARASVWKAREAYDWTTEIGVYVRSGRQGKGLGRELYAALFPALEAAGFKAIVAGIALPNPSSVRLHECFEMVHAGTLPKVGFKQGRWIDVGYWVRRFEGDPS